jgi:hypothetical protein
MYYCTVSLLEFRGTLQNPGYVNNRQGGISNVELNCTVFRVLVQTTQEDPTMTITV